VIYDVIAADGGFILAGCTRSATTLQEDTLIVSTDASGNQRWVQNYGGADDNCARAILQAADGGYALAGSRGAGQGVYNIYLVKTDSALQQQWTQSYGADHSRSYDEVIATADGGYLAAGTWTGINGTSVIYIEKIDAWGAIAWQQFPGTKTGSEVTSIVPCDDGGYLLTARAGNNVYTASDIYLVKIDSSGNMDWETVLGVSGEGEEVNTAIQTADGGFILAGAHYLPSNYGNLLLIKTDASGNQSWSWNYGASKSNWAGAIVQTADGGYITAGGKEASNFFDSDIWICKFDSSGKLQWERSHGTTESDYAMAMLQCDDGSLMVAGGTRSWGTAGATENAFLMKLNASGAEIWHQAYGGTGQERATNLTRALNGDYILAGITDNASTTNANTYIVRTDPDGNMIWEKNTTNVYGATWNPAVAPTTDNGCIVAGDKNFASLLIKTDKDGNFPAQGTQYRDE
jgi:hypothetical protein